jgi:eukaryotic-like serine/threonine-protein kinase
MSDSSGTPLERRPFGRYSLLYRFASGGMADVYLGRLVGEDGFERRVALKVIHDHLSKEENFVKMFIDEARLASRITHPNVALTLDLGKVGKTHFIAMEYVDGESLVALLRRVRPPLAYCARIIADSAAGLHAAHELRGLDGELMGVVHRDVSPQNILISYEGNVKVVDFGVARARGSLHTTSGQVKGKFSYMAPEQLLAPDKVDRRTDVFALGIILYEATTWTRLFKGDTESDQIHKVIKSEIQPPSKVVADYPLELEQIVMRALSRDLSQRFATAAELQLQLERYILSTGHPVMPSAIGEMMRQLFDDRIKAKKELLDRAILDQGTSSGVVSLEQPSGSSMVLGSVQSFFGTRRRTRIAFLIGALVVIVLGGALVGWRVTHRPEPASGSGSGAALAGGTSGSGSNSGSGSTVAARTPDRGAPTARLISIRVNARPASATVQLGGRPVGNPCKLEQPAREGEAELVISAPGYRQQRFTVALASGGAWEVALERLPSDVKRPHGKKKKKNKKGKGGLDDDDVLSNPYRRAP